MHSSSLFGKAKELPRYQKLFYWSGALDTIFHIAYVISQGYVTVS
jgi:hypothetical protein